jgi:hypothetical protein
MNDNSPVILDGLSLEFGSFREKKVIGIRLEVLKKGRGKGERKNRYTHIYAYRG